ncbi:MAG: hypothetical protein BWY82_01943 [Verrucomicrobia bacterium ADurb.Bin474]|nr:MAG: hypothetical protein BWY82_01943 [Verrucomicrobia bacterium ADurb.Bin474]
MSFVDDFWDRIPLAWGGFEADVAVCRDAFAVLDDGERSLMALGIIVCEKRDVDSAFLEIAGLVEMISIRSQSIGGGSEKESEGQQTCFRRD